MMTWNGSGMGWMKSAWAITTATRNIRTPGLPFGWSRTTGSILQDVSPTKPYPLLRKTLRNHFLPGLIIRIPIPHLRARLRMIPCMIRIILYLERTGIFVMRVRREQESQCAVKYGERTPKWICAQTKTIGMRPPAIWDRSPM